MRLILYSDKLKKIADLGNQYFSCLWKEDYNGTGSFSLELPATEKLRNLCRPDMFVRRNDRATVMLVKSVEFRGNKIVMSGMSALALLDDVAFFGTIKENTNVVSAIKTAYTNSHKNAIIDIGNSVISEKYPHQISNKSMLELSESMCQDTDVGIRAIKDGEKLLVDFYKPGVNKNAKFSRFIGNLKDETLTLSTAGYKNYAVVLGQGEAENRIREDVDLTNGDTRRELIVDADDLQQDDLEPMEAYRKRLQARGIEKLLETGKIWKCKFAPSSSDFGLKFNLGDIVTVVCQDFGLKFEARVVSFSQKDQNNKTTTSVEVGDLRMIKR